MRDTQKKKFTALVVDDDLDTVDLFAEFLSICGVEVLGKAFDGKTAVDMYSEISPDVVFSDVMMPEFDGFYVLENIKKINPKSIVVMVTGDVRHDTVDRLTQLKADSIIYKPFEMQKLITMVNDVLVKNVQVIHTSN